MFLKLAYSPCPNDTFMFDAMVHHKIDTEGLEFIVEHHDVEFLNVQSTKHTFDITKLSYHGFCYVSDAYVLLTSGSALGRGCGPLVVGLKPINKNDFPGASDTVAIPGKYTTANFLFSIAFPEVTRKIEMLFSDIEDSVITRKVDAGLLIHENRFTYQQKGLEKVIDLGEFWESKTGLPIPLGGIAVKRNLGNELIKKINRVLKRSILFALENPDSSSNYVCKFAQEMEVDVRNSHINLYVNNFSVDIGSDGKLAVQKMIETAKLLKIISGVHEPIFIDEI